MPKHSPTYLSKSRHGVYYFHYRIPKLLRDFTQTKRVFFRRSLGTKDRREAEKGAKRWWYRMDSLLQKIQNPELFKERYDSSLSALEEWNRIKQKAEIHRLSFADVEELMSEDMIADFDSPEKTDYIDPVGWAEETLKQIQDSQGTPLYERVMNIIHPLPQTLKTSFKDVFPDSATYSEVMSDYIKANPANCNEKNLKARIRGMEAFMEVNGDLPLNKYSKQHARKFRNTQLGLPVRWNSNKLLKGLTTPEAAETADNLGFEDNGFQRRSPATINLSINYVSALWSWAIPLYDHVDSNLMAGLLVPDSKGKRSKREPFTAEELQTIFTAPIYSGCKSDHYWHDTGTKFFPHSYKYIVALVGLFTGARMGEILQLHVSDVQKENGIWYLNIDTEFDEVDELDQETLIKSLKNEYSIRKVPIHPQLKKLGFLRHVEWCKKQGRRRLFEDVALANDNTYSSNYSKRFSEFLRKIKVKTTKNCFHSFRHTFKDACRNNGISNENARFLQGHAQGGQDDTYGSGSSIETLYKEISKIRFGKLDLSHIKID